jgi:hypothetical protein
MEELEHEPTTPAAPLQRHIGKQLSARLAFTYSASCGSTHWGSTRLGAVLATVGTSAARRAFRVAGAPKTPDDHVRDTFGW